MKILKQTEDALLELQGRPGLPQSLTNYLEARFDSACGQCWLSSAGPMHHDCRKKIDRHFNTEDELFAFARRECKV